MSDIKLDKLYSIRFSGEETSRKRDIWKVIVKDFLQKFVSKTDTVIDLACGYGEFINNIDAKRKIAIDLNCDSINFLLDDVDFKQGDVNKVLESMKDLADIVFASNFLEHLPDKQALNTHLYNVWHSLKPEGKYIILGPNLRYLPGRYWDYYDHTLP